MGFYEEIVDQYDLITRFHERLYQETTLFTQWRDRYGFHSVLDVACGTGVHCIALARIGVQVAGADISEAMLNQAKENARHFNAQVSWVHVPMQLLRPHVHGQYDAILCLGNSLPHLLHKSELDATFQNFYDLLVPNGIVGLQLLNYHRILTEQERIVGIHRQKDAVYVRFYDFQQERILFNLLAISFAQNGTSTHSLHSTFLFPYRQYQLEEGLIDHGFTNFEYYGDMLFHPFEEDISTNLVIVARKRA